MTLALRRPAAAVGTRPVPEPPPAACPLDAVVPGRRARVQSVAGARARRLAELGVRPGAVVTVLAANSGGGRTVAVGTTRLALDRSVLALIAVTPDAA